MSPSGIIVLGTSASVGKSVIAVALCRFLHRQGRDVVPFKAMNVLHGKAATTLDDTTLNQMQWLQATAADVQPAPYINPVLFDTRGEGVRILTYGERNDEIEELSPGKRSEALRSIILSGYRQATSAHEFAIVEGCGSPVEINIQDRDLSNLWLAKSADLQCILVADIERCGVFASMIGTLGLMTQDERDRVRGFIINKFHGSTDSFRDGVAMLEERTNLPCLGIVPRLVPLAFPAEDSLEAGEFGANDASLGPSLESPATLYLDEIDRWTDHVLANCESELLVDLLSST